MHLRAVAIEWQIVPVNARLKTLSTDALALPPEERAELKEILWDSLAEMPQQVPIPDWHRVELERRRAEHRSDPRSAVPWQTALDRIEVARRDR